MCVCVCVRERERERERERDAKVDNLTVPGPWLRWYKCGMSIG